MKKRSFLIALLLFSFYTQLHSQIRITGKVQDAQNKRPIPYANIGILHTTVGTISNPDGSFSIEIPAHYSSRNLMFSAIGFEQKAIKASTFTDSQPVTISLVEKIITLDEVTISAKKEKKETIKLGNGKSLLPLGRLQYDSTTAGSAMALLINNEQSSHFTFPVKASLWITKNKLPTFKVRLRFLEVDSMSRPGKDIINKSIVIESDINKGWINFDLSPYRYKLDRPFFYLMFEWILDRKDRQYISKAYAEYIRQYPDRVTRDTVIVDGEKIPKVEVSTVVAGTIFGVTESKSSLKEHVTYYRTNSFGDWKRASGILSANVIMSNLPAD